MRITSAQFFAYCGLCAALIFFVSAGSVSATLGDGAVSNIQLLDTNANQKIDRITLTVANPSGGTWQLNGSSPYGLSVTQSGSPVSISSVSLTNATSNPVTLTINLNESQITETTDGVNEYPIELTYSPTASYNTSPNIMDGTDEQLQAILGGDTSVSNTERDATPPVMLSGQFEDSNSDGVVDLVRTYWSEPVTADKGSVSDWQFTSGTIGMTLSAAPSDGSLGRELDLTVNTVQKQTDSPVVPTLRYVKSVAQVVRDAAQVAALNVDPINIVDKARPVITEALSGDVDADGTIDLVKITFSEIVNITDAGPDNDFKLNVNYSGGAATIADGRICLPDLRLVLLLMPMNK